MVKQFLAVLLISLLIYNLLGAFSGLIAIPNRYRHPTEPSVKVDTPEKVFFDRLRVFFVTDD